jgi:hypothetical protein
MQFTRIPAGVFQQISDAVNAQPPNAGELFDLFHQLLSARLLRFDSSAWRFDAIEPLFRLLIASGLVAAEQDSPVVGYALTEVGRRFRNRMLTIGDREERRRLLWSIPASGA